MQMYHLKVSGPPPQRLYGRIRNPSGRCHAAMWKECPEKWLASFPAVSRVDLSRVTKSGWESDDPSSHLKSGPFCRGGFLITKYDKTTDTRQTGLNVCLVCGPHIQTSLSSGCSLVVLGPFWTSSAWSWSWTGGLLVAIHRYIPYC